MSKLDKLVSLISLLLVLLLPIGCSGLEPNKLTYSVELVRSYSVVRVVDGDTIKIVYGGKETSVRYIGINTPETVDPRKPVEYFGKEASSKNRELVEGREVYLEYDVERFDQYDRILAYVWLTSSIGDINSMVNYILVKEGYAQVATYPPNVKYIDRFVEAQEYASKNNLGLWGD